MDTFITKLTANASHGKTKLPTTDFSPMKVSMEMVLKMHASRYLEVKLIRETAE